jgi:hypothetical protein
VVAQEDAPLAAVGNFRCLRQDLGDRITLRTANGHEHAGHEREVEAHVALTSFPEVLHDIGRPLVRLSEQHTPGKLDVDGLADALQILVRLREVLAVGAIPLEQIGHRVEPVAVEPEIEPEADDVEHRLLNLGIVVVQIRLMVEEAMPVVLLAQRLIGPVRRLGVDEDDARIRPLLVVLAPHVPVRLRVVA